MISVIVCTYNRAEILREALKSLVEQSVSASSFEVIVVDNNSKDSTKSLVDEYVKTHSNFRYVLEKNQGLSFARNSGAASAVFDWVLYMDDDALASTTMVERALYDINNYSFDCFGGTYTAWFKYGRPRWMPADFGTKTLLTDKVSQIFTSQLDGGLFCIRKDWLLKAGGFSTELGMAGNRIAYGEETALQERLLRMNCRLGFDPELRMEHLVGKHKLNVWWHIKAEYAKGRDSMKVIEAPLVKKNLWLQIKFLAKDILVELPTNIKKLKNKSYYFENVILDTLKPIFFRYGQQSK